SRPDRHGAKDRQPLVTSSRAPRPVLYRASPRSRGSDDEGAVCETAVTPIAFSSMKFVGVASRAAGSRKMRPTATPSASMSKSSSFHSPETREADTRLRTSWNNRHLRTRGHNPTGQFTLARFRDYDNGHSLYRSHIPFPHRQCSLHKGI